GVFRPVAPQGGAWGSIFPEVKHRGGREASPAEVEEGRQAMKPSRSVFALALLASISGAQPSPDTDLKMVEKASEDAFFTSPKIVEMNNSLAKLVEAKLGAAKAKTFMDGFRQVQRGAYKVGYGDAKN